MIIDAAHLYSDSQAISSAASTNVIDHGIDRNIGIGTPLAVVIVVEVELDDTSGNETYTAKVQTDDDEAFGSATDVTPAFSLPRGSPVGTRFVIPIPPNTDTKRYTRLLYAVGGTTPTGTVTAFLTRMDMIQNDVHYPDAITISG